MVRVEVVYVPKEKEAIQLTLALEEGATVGAALIASGIYDTHPETQNLPVGLFSKPIALEASLKSGDRLEIYRFLFADPKEKRRRLASRNRH